MKDFSSNPWIFSWRRKPQAKVRLLCFPYAGGGATVFRSWSESLPPEIEVCAIQLPGHESRLSEQPISHLPALLSAFAFDLPACLDKPYALFGHSMGALIAFEVIRFLQASEYREGLQHLFVSGHRAPQLPDPHVPVSHLSDAEFIDKLRHFHGTPEEVLKNKELLRLFLPTLRADFALCENYVYKHENPLTCSITAFGGLQDPEVSQENILAWQEQTSSPFSAYFFEGDHFFLQKEREKLLHIITKTLLHI